MMLAHKIALDPNDGQAAGTARFAYNWALNAWQKQYAAGKVEPTVPKPSDANLRRQLNAIKREQFPGLLDVTKNAPPRWRSSTGAQRLSISSAAPGNIPRLRRRAATTVLR